MPNSPIRRFESCYMPPKKFAWRFDNVNPTESKNTSVKETENFSPVKEEQNKMGLMSKAEMESEPPDEQTSLTEKPQSPSVPEDAPLDFSVRSQTSTKNLCNSNEKRIKNEEFKHFSPHSGYFDDVKNLQMMPSTVFPGMSRDRNSPSSRCNGNPGIWFRREKPLNELQDYSLCNGNQSSTEMETSERLNECNISASGINGGTVICRKSPESNLPRENSPNSLSILQGMLAAKDNGCINKISSKLQDIHVNSTSPQQGNNNNELASAVSPDMIAASQQMMPHLLPSVNGYPLPLTTFPFIGGVGCIRPPPGFLAQVPETSVLQALTRRTRRKRSNERPFKSYPIEVLEEKLQSVSANGYAFGLEPSKLDISSRTSPQSPPSDPGRTCNMTESPEHLNGAINSNLSPAANGTDNPTSVHFSGESNDSLPALRTETAEATSCTNSRKRKSTAEVEKDDAYWDRRKKNNLAAKRSREARRRKEDAIAKMALLYESQNMELHQKLAAMTFKLNEITTQFGRVLRENENLTIQNNILQERLSQKRCGHCGTQLPSIN